LGVHSIILPLFNSNFMISNVGRDEIASIFPTPSACLTGCPTYKSSGLYKLADAILRCCNGLKIKGLRLSVCKILGALQNGLIGRKPSTGRQKLFSDFHGAMKLSSK